MYVPRGLEPRLLEALSASPVVVLEGPRAVGKSTMCDELVRRGAIAVRRSLTDPTTYDLAARDLRGWLASLPTPAVIDEAQLIDGLSVAVKDLVDRPGRRQFVLTGSVSLGRHGLGGSDPLAGRALRLCLRPFTQLELAVGTRRSPLASVVDRMFSGPPGTGTGEQLSRDLIALRMTRGGFPLRAIGEHTAVAARVRRNQVDADIEAALTEVRLVDERFDAFLARRTLDAVAGVPGGILNVSKLGGELGIARQTVDSYLGHLERRFLVYRLPNVGARPRAHGVGTARPKVHPVDTAMSIGILTRMGQRFRESAELSGALLESFVVNDLVAQAGWSEINPEVGYWRDTSKRGDAEVDLVLMDGHSRIVGIEVKSSESVRGSDARGLLALRAARGLHRGFIVYQGADVVELDQSIWALPIRALSDLTMWENSVSDTRTAHPAHADHSIVGSARSDTEDLNYDPTSAAASVFVSYVHADDEYENGAIRAFVERLAATYEFLFGESLEIFLDRDVRWGEAWQARLNAELERTTFLLAIVTPRFLNSRHCREEVMTFSVAVRDLGQPRLVLPLIWREPPALRAAGDDDLLVAALRKAQWEPVDDLRLRDPGSMEYRTKLEALAERLNQTIVSLDRPQPSVGVTPVAAAEQDGDDDDLLELVIDVEDRSQQVVHEFGGLEAAAREFDIEMRSLPQLAPAAGPRQVRVWAGQVAATMEPATAGLQSATRVVRERWTELDERVTQLLRRVDEISSDEQQSTALRDSITELHDTFSGVADDPAMTELRSTLARVAAMTRRLRPVAGSVRAALDLMSEMRASTVAWLQLLDRHGRAE